MAEFFKIGNTLINPDQIAFVDFNFTARGHQPGKAACIYFAFAANGVDMTDKQSGEGGPYMMTIANDQDLAELRKQLLAPHKY